MKKLNQKDSSEYIVCSNCSYEANEKDLTECEICGHPLSVTLTVTESPKKLQLAPQKRSLNPSRFISPLLLLIAGGGLLLSLNQVLFTNNKQQIVSNNQGNHSQTLQKITRQHH